ncbi:MAG: MFS transporter [Nanoarchaeota archaeon]|nr:MFS transporter [Nanoarchaeota archaeon]MBU4086717.1 MFS transporter [Nanoarchaeota archaeon]
MQIKKQVSITREALKNKNISEKKQKIILGEVKDKLERERTMKLSIKEGMAASVMSGAGDAYISPFAIALNANNAQIGLLSSIPQILSPLSQIFGSKLMEKYSRRRIIINFVSLQALMWLPILTLGLFFWGNLFREYLPILLIVIYSLYAGIGALASPAWFSLMGDIIPERIRGKYFSKRSRLTGATALITTLSAAFFLDFFKTKGIVLVGFSIIFLVACIFRIISVFIFKKHYYPQFNLEKNYYFSIWQFLKKAPSNNFGRFTFYVSLMHFASAIAGPFFAVYMLRELGFSYIMFMLTIIATSITTLIVLPVLGKFSDRYGNRELLRSGSFLIPIIPFLWLFSKSPVYLIIVPSIISGLGWAAFNLASSNFIYDSVSVQRRGICIAYFNAIVGAGIFLGAITGGLLAQYLEIGFMSKILFLFIISGILRFLAYLTIPVVKEIRQIKKPASRYLVYLKEMKVVREDLYSIFNSVSHLFKQKSP